MRDSSQRARYRNRFAGRESGVTTGEMTRWCNDSRLIRRGHDVYKLARWVPTPYDPFAEAVALAGDGAYLRGDAVLSMHGLTLVDLAAVTVATPRHIRMRLPAWVRPIPTPKGCSPSLYEGIPSQSVADALRAYNDSVMPERSLEAADEARGKASSPKRNTEP